MGGQMLDLLNGNGSQMGVTFQGMFYLKFNSILWMLLFLLMEVKNKVKITTHHFLQVVKVG
jgi:hypothetical protein